MNEGQRETFRCPLFFGKVKCPAKWQTKWQGLRRCPLRRGPEGFSAFSGVARERPNRDAPGMRPTVQCWRTRRSDTLHRQDASRIEIMEIDNPQQNTPYANIRRKERDRRRKKLVMKKQHTRLFKIGCAVLQSNCLIQAEIPDNRKGQGPVC